MISATKLTLQPVAEQLVDAASCPANLDDAYNKYIQSVLSEPLWAPGSPGRSRIPWRLAAQTKQSDAAWRATFCQPGLYLFGSSTLVPLYWGKTNRTLWRRLTQRYIASEDRILTLAGEHEKALVDKGLEGFPEGLMEKSSRNPVFFKLAVQFARHGINGIWLTVIPLSPHDDVPKVESRIIRAGNAWNKSRGLPPLLNKQHA